MKRLIAFALAVILFSAAFNVGAVGTSAGSAVLINGDTGEILYSQNAYERRSMASTTKIMTGLLLSEYGDLDKEITVTKQMVCVEGTSMGLLPGDKVTLHDLLYGLLLASGNDAANVIAYTLGGTVDGFVALMNKKAAALGLQNTHFVTPSGLDAQEHYTTAYDMAVLTKFALKNETFARTVATKKATLCYGNPPYKRTLTNHNKLLNMSDSAVGVKTGYTKKSGRCLVSAAKKDGKFVIAVTLNDGNDWQDHLSMIDYGFSVLKPQSVSSGECLVPVIGANKDSVKAVSAGFDISTLGVGEITCEIRKPRFLYAPIEENEVVGYAVYKYNDTEIASVPLYAAEGVKALTVKDSVIKRLTENIEILFKCIWEK